MAFAQNPASVQDVSVIIVDDAKFTLEMLRRVLKSSGYRDIRVATTAHQALGMMRERKANLLVADWLMPEMDGLSLTKRVRQIDEESNHYTYIIVLTAKEGMDSLAQAFEHGVDDFVNKSPDNKELLARVHAAGRISALQNDLLKANRRLTELNRQLDSRHSFDVLTGLGNRAYMEKQLANLVRHVEARGGVACLAAIRINDFEDLGGRYGEKIASEILEATANRLQQTVRPLDVVGRLNDDTFAILMHQEDASRCHPNAFRRIHQALNLRAYKTSAGFLSVTAAIAISGLNQEQTERHPAPRDILDFVCSNLDEAQKAATVYLAQWSTEAP